MFGLFCNNREIDLPCIMQSLDFLFNPIKPLSIKKLAHLLSIM